MFRRIGRIGLVLSLTCTYLVQISTPGAQAADVTFTHNFTSGSNSTSSAWQTFKNALTGSYGSFTFGGTNGSITVTDPTRVQTLANGMRNNTTTSVTINGTTWYYLYIGGTQEEFGNQSSWSCSATSPMYVFRPTIGNQNWGGITTSGAATSCSQAAQTMTITFSENAPTPTTFSTSLSTPSNIGTSGNISYSLVLSQSVTDLSTSDFQFGGSSTCNTPVGLTGSGTTYQVTVTNCSEGNLILQLKANSVTSNSITGPATVASANVIVIDRTAPIISSITAPVNQTYAPGNGISFSLNMAETVTVSGTPRLSLTVGSTTRYANYTSGSNSKALTFTYVVQSSTSDVDLDGITLSTPLELNGGSISDLASNTLSNLAVSTTSLTSVLVAQPAAAPTIDSVTATSGQLEIYFTPGDARGSTTSTYQYSSNGGAFTNRASGTTASPLIITGLSNGTRYTIRIRATTNAGAGDSSTAITETPTAISVTGDSGLVLTYGSSASSGPYSATGGTSTYTWSLGSSLTGVTLSGTTVTASSSTPAGTYSQTVRATDGNGQVGSKSLTITVSKASTTISIALPNSSSTAALGGAITITATVPQAGAVNFKLGGSTISGCGSTSASSTTATCSWTPGALGSVSLSATFTPTDTSNFETSTSTTLSITVVNGVSSIALSLAGGTTTPAKGQSINIIAAIDQAGKVSFFVDGKRIPSCQNMSASIGNKSCAWKPAVQKQVNLTATLVPSNNVYNRSTSSLAVRVIKRAGPR